MSPRMPPMRLRSGRSGLTGPRGIRLPGAASAGVVCPHAARTGVHHRTLKSDVVEREGAPARGAGDRTRHPVRPTTAGPPSRRWLGVRSLLAQVERVKEGHPGDTVTVVVPGMAASHRWRRGVFSSLRALRLKLALYA